MTTSEGIEADVWGDPRFHQLQSRFRPQNIGMTIRKNF